MPSPIRQTAFPRFGNEATTTDLVLLLRPAARWRPARQGGSTARNVTGQMIAVDAGQQLAWRTADVVL